nr:PREDICTED: uncharacterized protein C11orf96-like [Anolis carolinensis]|eukprot:XP_008102473.1 PREDICTED: uncharacterized protein C11orf96-like [Anolis carolinensis]
MLNATDSREGSLGRQETSGQGRLKTSGKQASLSGCPAVERRQFRGALGLGRRAAGRGVGVARRGVGDFACPDAGAARERRAWSHAGIAGAVRSSWRWRCCWYAVELTLAAGRARLGQPTLERAALPGLPGAVWGAAALLVAPLLALLVLGQPARGPGRGAAPRSASPRRPRTPPPQGPRQPPPPGRQALDPPLPAPIRVLRSRPLQRRAPRDGPPPPGRADPDRGPRRAPRLTPLQRNRVNVWHFPSYNIPRGHAAVEFLPSANGF